MCRVMLVVFLAICLSCASTAAVPVKEARDTEQDESTVVPSNTKPAAALGPEVPDMLSGATVNQTFLHKVDNDNDEPGIIAAPVPELSTYRSVPEHETNLTDKVNSPRVLDPGTTHQEESSNKSSPVLPAHNATKEDAESISQPTLKPPADITTVVPVVQQNVKNKVQTSTSAPTNKTEEAVAIPAVKNTNKTEEQNTGKAEASNNTQALQNSATQPPPPPSKAAEATPNPTTTQAPAKSETKPQVPPSEQVEVFAPPILLNESQNLLAGYQPHTSEQHADQLQLSGTADPSFLQPSQSAAILAGVFVVVALLGYVGLLVWRRLLEKKYGNREMLVNEDEFYDTSDLRHFEL